jgi:hypothetical protein
MRVAALRYERVYVLVGCCGSAVLTDGFDVEVSDLKRMVSFVPKILSGLEPVQLKRRFYSLGWLGW